MTTKLIYEVKEISGQWLSGYITYSTLQDDTDGVREVVYGLFVNTEDARKWAEGLNGNTMIIPVYHPVHNRG